MSLTNAEAQNLIEIPKKIFKDNSIIEKIALPNKNKVQFTLHPEDEAKKDTFLLSINKSDKNDLKLTLHFQEGEFKIGLLRIDYNSRHFNPSNILITLPDKFKKYAGKSFNYGEHHMHYYVEGYKPLSWAIPLFDDDFSIKKLNNANNVFDVIECFAKKIYLTTEFKQYQNELDI